MKILVIGGTIFVGRHIVEAALKRGHEVTLFNRGRTDATLFSDVEKVIGDRSESLDSLDGRSWDVVIDTSGYLPRVVRKSCEALKSRCELYVFISTGSVYKDKSKPGITEDFDTLVPKNSDALEWSDETYGELKSGCEVVVQNAFADRALIIRPGVVVGPYDPTDRFTYWPVRVLSGGTVLSPGHAESPVQFIDARDLADFTISLCESKSRGVYNAIGPDYRLTMSKLLNDCKTAAGSNAHFAWVSDEELLKHNVEPWTELPFWIPENSETSGMALRNNNKGIEAGLKFRPLLETITDTLAWWQSEKTGCDLKAGLSKEREEELLLATRSPASTQ
ncbi:MAG: NAD-dependent epimerase/dehydratase family protein [Candidatus Melainabacteria bacterium]|nr:NAD-dependent epimerase/dehydratase family protein [Candidatus Melainabacteria bacterium]